MFSFNHTEQVFQKRSRFSLRCEMFLSGLLSKRFLARPYLKAAIFASKHKFSFLFLTKSITRLFSCTGNLQDFKNITAANFQDRFYTCLLPIEPVHPEGSDWFMALRGAVLNQPGLSYIMLNVDDFIEPRILSLVSNDGLLNQQDRTTFLEFTEQMELLCESLEAQGKSVVFYTPSFSTFPALHALALEMMRKFNTENVTVHLLFHLCHINSQKQIIEMVRTSLEQGFTPGIAIAKYLTMDFKAENRDGEAENGSPCHSYAQTKRTFFEVTRYLLKNTDILSAFIISHNPDNLLYIASLMETYQVSPTNPRVTIGQRYGMAKHIGYNPASKGYHVALIVPYGSPQGVLQHLCNLYCVDPSLPKIFSELRQAIKKELHRRALENGN